jgi:hypothetical protein
VSALNVVERRGGEPVARGLIVVEWLVPLVSHDRLSVPAGVGNL